MAHVAKYSAAACGGMCAHYDRTPELERGYERENIDPTRTHLNYNAAPTRGTSQVDFINERIASLDLKRAPRKDAVRMCDCVVTMPKSLDPSRGREFFASAYAFLADRYGADNVVSAYVHLDEKTPHMHFAWVPVTEDGRLSAKDVVSRRDLKTLHGDMKKALERDLGCEVEVILDPEKEGEKQLSHLDQKEYKAAKDAIAAKRRESAELDDEIYEKHQELVDLDDEIDVRTVERDGLRDEVAREQQRLEGLQRACKEVEPATQTVAESARTLWKARNDGEREKVLAGEVEGLRSRISEFEGANQRARERVAELDRGLPGLRGRYRELEQRFRAVELRVTKAIQRLREVPETLSAWALEIADRLGKRTYNPNSLEYVARRATEAARSQQRQPFRGRDHGRGFSR